MYMQELEENLGRSTVKNKSSKGKDRMVIDSWPPVQFEFSKRELQGQKKEAEKQKKMEFIDNAL